MDTLKNSSSPKPLLNRQEEEIFAALLHPMLMTLILGAGYGVCAVTYTLLSINGVMPIKATGNAWDWAKVWIGAIMASASLIGMVVVKPLALAFIARSRSMDARSAR